MNIDRRTTDGRTEVRGLHVDIYAREGTPAKYAGKRIVLVGIEDPPDAWQTFSGCNWHVEDENTVLFTLVDRGRWGVAAYPVEARPDMIGPMADGRFLYSHDSRFARLNNYLPIPLHDRFETAEQYRALSQ